MLDVAALTREQAATIIDRGPVRDRGDLLETHNYWLLCKEAGVRTLTDGEWAWMEDNGDWLTELIAERMDAHTRARFGTDGSHRQA